MSMSKSVSLDQIEPKQLYDNESSVIITNERTLFNGVKELHEFKLLINDLIYDVFAHYTCAMWR